jgi:hypothetical protein
MDTDRVNRGAIRRHARQEEAGEIRTGSLVSQTGIRKNGRMGMRKCQPITLTDVGPDVVDD